MTTPPETITERKPRHLLRKLGLSLLTLLVLAAIGEVLVRTLTDVRQPLLLVDASVGRHYIPDFDGILYSGESDRDIPVRFNRHGLRFEDVPFEKPAGTRRLVLIGDSLIAGLEVNVEDTVCVQLEDMLERAHPGERWEVLNFGISGSSTGQEYLLYKEIASKYDPDIVLCAFFVGNDFGGNSTRLSSLNYIYFDVDEAGVLTQVPFPSPRLQFNEYLNRYSRLYVWQKAFVNSKSRKMVRGVAAMTEDNNRLIEHGDRIRASEWVYCRTEHEVAQYTWDVTRALFTAFAEEVKQDGARFGIVMIPASEQFYDEDFAMIAGIAERQGVVFDVNYPAERLASISADLDVPFIDLVGPLRAATPSHRRDAQEEWHHFKGIGHLNERGHTVVASALLEALEESYGVGAAD